MTRKKTKSDFVKHSPMKTALDEVWEADHELLEAEMKLERKLKMLKQTYDEGWGSPKQRKEARELLEILDS